MAKKYIVDLSEDEVSQLLTLMKTGKHKARIISHVHILLMATEGKLIKLLQKPYESTSLLSSVLEKNLYLGVWTSS